MLYRAHAGLNKYYLTILQSINSEICFIFDCILHFKFMTKVKRLMYNIRSNIILSFHMCSYIVNISQYVTNKSVLHVLVIGNKLYSHKWTFMSNFFCTQILRLDFSLQQFVGASYFM